MPAFEQNDLYEYPDVYVCLYNFFGCDSLDLEEQCIGTVHSTEGGETKAFFNPLDVNPQEISTDASLTDEVRIRKNDAILALLSSYCFSLFCRERVV